MFYRLRRSANYGLFRLKTRGIHSSPPIACQQDAPCEIHTMLSERDVPLYVVAIKSFLRYYPVLSVVVHSDGSLSQASVALIRHHVEGCKIIPVIEADDRARREIGTNSALSRWRGLDASYRRVIDTEIWSSSKRRIIMDADILVMDYPEEVVNWIEHGESPFLIGQPPSPGPPASNGSVSAPRHMQTTFKEKVGPLSESLGYPERFLDGTTSGFYGCTDELPLERIERVLKASTDLGIPMTEWGGEQCTVLYLLSVAGAVRLDSDRYFNFFADQVHKVDGARLIHFIGTDRFYKNIYANCASKVIESLFQAQEPVAVG